MSAYNFFIGMLAIFLAILVWLPTVYMFDTATETFNGLITGPDSAELIQSNNTMSEVVYYSLFFVILGIIIFILKRTRSNEEEGRGQVIYYNPATMFIRPGDLARSSCRITSGGPS